MLPKHLTSEFHRYCSRKAELSEDIYEYSFFSMAHLKKTN